jgi:two-component system sensor kinase FixL
MAHLMPQSAALMVEALVSIILTLALAVVDRGTWATLSQLAIVGNAFPTVQLAMAQGVTERTPLFLLLDGILCVIVIARFSRQQSEAARLHAALTAQRSAIAHELAQPLAAATNFVELARFERDAQCPGRDGVVAALDEAGDQLASAAAILSRMQFLGSHRPASDGHFDPGAPVFFALRMIDDAIRAVRATVVVDVDPAFGPVQGDAVQVQQVLTNLVGNALEAMSQSDRRTLTVRAFCHDRGRAITYVVSDTGSGIAPHLEQRLFQPVCSTKPDGQGIGLSICAAIVAAHGGKIGARRNRNGGADFWFRLPLAEPRGGWHAA